MHPTDEPTVDVEQPEQLVASGLGAYQGALDVDGEEVDVAVMMLRVHDSDGHPHLFDIAIPSAEGARRLAIALLNISEEMSSDRDLLDEG